MDHLRKLLFLFFSITVFGQVGGDSLWYQYDDIIITATRYPERIIEIPFAVNYIATDKVPISRPYGVHELLAGIPGVLAQNRYGTQDLRITIRGFGARGAGDRSNAGTSRGIRVLSDGIPETEPDGRTAFDFIDPFLVETTELVRSNASALWGNASGGLLQFSQIPAAKPNSVKAMASFGGFGFSKFGAKAVWNNDNGLVFGGATTVRSDGWRAHSAGTQSIFSAGVVSSVGEHTRAKAIVSAVSNVFHIPGPLTLDEFNTDPAKANATYLANDERRNNRLARLMLGVDHDFTGDNSLSTNVYVNPKYLQRSERGTYRDFNRYHIGANTMFKTVFAPGEGYRNILSAGGDAAYQDGAILFYNLSATKGRGDVLRDNKREGAATGGVFVQNELQVENQLTVIAGLRYESVKYMSQSYINPKLGLQEKTFSKLTPKGGVSYLFSPTHSVYANLGGGIEVPAGNETDPAGTYGQDTVYLINPLLEPITSYTIEAGTKHDLLIGGFLKSVSYEAALYYISIKNDIIPYRGGRFYFTAGKTSRTGADLSVTLSLAHGISFSGAFTYMNSKNNDYRVDSVHYDKTKAGKFADYSGKKSAGIPGNFYSFALGYVPPFATFVSASVTFSGVSKYFVDDANTIEVPAYSIIGLTIRTTDIPVYKSVAASFNFGVANLADKSYAGSAFVNPDLVSGKAVYLEPGLPRNMVFGASVTF